MTVLRVQLALVDANRSKYVGKFVLCVLLCSCAAATSTPREPLAPSSATTPANAGRTAISLNVCFRNEKLLGEQTIGLSRIIKSLAEAVVALGSAPARIGVGRCEDESFRGCIGRPGVIACRADDLAQLAAAVSIGAQLIARVPSARERFTTTGAIGPSDAIAALARSEVDGDAVESRRSLMAWIAEELQVPPELVSEAGEAGTRFLHQDSITQLAIGADAFKLMLAFIVGHELFHGRGAVCSEARLAVSEEDALFNFATDATSRAQLLCESSPNTDELLADRCGLRMLRYSRPLELERTQDGQLRDALASELLAWALITAHHEELLLDKPGHLTHFIPGYLHPMLRVVLTTNELKLLAHSGAPAQGGQTLDDQIVQRLPRGVVQALAGRAVASDASFWCSGTQARRAPVH
jgi:hypothetical protein